MEWPASGPSIPPVDNTYPFDYPNDHPELNLTAEDIEAIGSVYHSPISDPPAPVHHVQDTQDVQNAQDETEAPIDHGYGPEGIEELVDDEDFLPIPEDPEPGRREHRGGGAASRRMANQDMKGLTGEEKLKRQRENNKKAAERSRAKRRKDMDSTEVQVTQLRRENERLRARLNSLRNVSSAGIDSFPVVPGPTLVETLTPTDPSLGSANGEPVNPNDIGIDRIYNHKLAVELANAKATLVEKYFELERAKGRDMEEGVDTARRELVHKIAGVYVLRAEEKAMGAVLRLLGDETTELGSRRRAIQAEVARRTGAASEQTGNTGIREEETTGHSEVDEEERRRTSEEEAASHTQVLAQAVRDVAMGEARVMEGQEGGSNGYDMPTYIESMDGWPEHNGAEL